MKGKQVIARSAEGRKAWKSWRRIAREAQVLGCTPAWKLMLGAGVWPQRMSMPSRGIRF